jgi:multiple sugar transport system ATP-binding protein
VIDVPVDLVEDLGSEVHVLFGVDAPPVVTSDTVAAVEDEAVAEPGAFSSGPSRSTFTARVDARVRVAAGERVALAVDTERFYFFDPGTGEAAGTRGPASVATAPAGGPP